MNRDVIEGKWHEMKGHAKVQWGRLTDDDLAKFDGTKEKLIGIVQQKYGYARDAAQKAVDQFWEHETSEAAKEV